MIDHDIFLEKYSEALERAEALFEEKSRSGYNSEGEDIFEFWINGCSDLIYEIHKKSLRLKRVYDLTEKKGKTDSDLIDNMEDSALDLINYAAFLWAYIHIKEKDCDKDSGS